MRTCERSTSRRSERSSSRPGVATRMCASLTRCACERIGTPPYAAATRRPLACASGWNSAVTCAASSRVGTSTSAEGRGSPGAVRSTIGRAKASVLPEPVGERTRTSSPCERVRQDELLDAERVLDRASGERGHDGRGHAKLAKTSF